MLLIFSVFSFVTLAQNNVSKPKNFHIVKQFVPPILDIVDNNILFVDADGNNFINAQENCKLRFQVCNRGVGDGLGCKATVMAKGATSGLLFTDITLQTLKTNDTIWVEIPIKADLNTEDGTVTFSIKVDEPNGFGCEPVHVQIDTRKFESPFVEIVSQQIIGGKGALLTKREPFILKIMVQNTGYGYAENVKLDLKFPSDGLGVFCTSGNKSTTIAKLESNEIKIIEYQFITNNNYNFTDLPITVNISEKYNKYAKSDTINLKFGQIISGNNVIAVTGKEEQQQTITKGSFYSDVDVNIPQIPTENENTFAVIIGNENYKTVSNVPYALNDSKIFKEYCEKTLGIPAKQIKYVPDATLNDIRTNINWLKDITDVYSDVKVIFYYAGHGIPDDASKSAYLLPVDGYGSDVTTGFSVDKLYFELGSMSAKFVTVFLDACFSGAKREGDMLMSARGVAIRTKSGQPVGNMVVFTASTGDETAAGNDKEHHGLFTYYLLKKIQETQGDVTYDVLANFIKENVEKHSVLEGKRQTPTVIHSAEVQSMWKTWKLR